MTLGLVVTSCLGLQKQEQQKKTVLNCRMIKMKTLCTKDLIDRVKGNPASGRKQLQVIN
jgi:hypothetical protein